MLLSEYKTKKKMTLQKLADAFDTNRDKIFRWCRDGAEIKRIKGVRSIVLNKVVAEEV